jgi:hypothetical protein
MGRDKSCNRRKVKGAGRRMLGGRTADVEVRTRRMEEVKLGRRRSSGSFHAVSEASGSDLSKSTNSVLEKRVNSVYLSILCV